jgi:serine protease inhibitor ecotin
VATAGGRRPGPPGRGCCAAPRAPPAPGVAGDQPGPACSGAATQVPRTCVSEGRGESVCASVMIAGMMIGTLIAVSSCALSARQRGSCIDAPAHYPAPHSSCKGYAVTRRAQDSGHTLKPTGNLAGGKRKMQPRIWSCCGSNLVVLWQRAESNRGYLADVTSSAAATIMACPAAHRYRQRIYIDSIIETVRRRLLRAERSVGNYVTH